MKLHLGVVDIPYVDAPEPGKRKAKRAPAPAQTTGEVAERLEGEYHVMGHFFEAHGGDIAAALEDGLAGALETLLMGGSPGQQLFSSGEARIDEAFRKFLEAKEMDALGYPGVPTKASLMGVNHRLKIKRGPVRPSFIDTGLYSSSFKSWVD